ncbi:MAG: DUF1800 family protein [Phycisphaerales bacterium JB052]
MGIESTETRQPTGRVETSMLPIRDEEFGYRQARHLLWRAGFGGTDEQIRTLAEWGPAKAVDFLIDYQSIPAEADAATAFDHDIMRPRTRVENAAFMRAQRAGDENALSKFREMRQRAQREDREQMREIRHWWITRMIQTPRPLEEKMTLFWHGHFATSYRTIEDSYHMYQQNRMLRGLALGNFGDLLRSIIRDPAMLRYLNNNRNQKTSPNENLARELMELFSLGEGHYNERDIKEGARALTGYTYKDDAFFYAKDRHDEGSKHILGVTGNLDGDGFVNSILRSPFCAPFICAKLYKYFVADIPTDTRQLEGAQRSVVQSLSKTMQQSRYELRPVMRKLLLSRHFYDPSVMGNKIKSPVELVVGAVRSLNTPVRNLTVLINAIDTMGQSLFLPPSVKGWDGGRAWINTSTLFTRQNTLVYMVTGEMAQTNRVFVDRTHYDPSSLVACLNDPRIDGAPPAELIANQLMDLVLGRRPYGASEHLISAAHKVDKPASSEGIRTMLLLTTSMPEYQLC